MMKERGKKQLFLFAVNSELGFDSSSPTFW